jgi:carboxylesterase type B
LDPIHKVFMFQFKHPPIWEQAANPNANAIGANHACELPFIFHILRSKGGGRAQTLVGPQEVELSATLGRYLAQFAATGDPNSNAPYAPSALPWWGAYDTARQQVMLLDTADAGGCRSVDQLRQGQCEFWATIPDDATPQQ